MVDERLERVATIIDKYIGDMRPSREAAAAVLAELAGEIADSERYQHVTRYVSANNKEFYFFGLPTPPEKWYHGSIKEHFDNAIDEARG